MLSIIRNLLAKIIKDIDTGNSNIDNKEAEKIIDFVKQYTDKTVKLSKYQACQFLNMGRANFDNYVREGLLPRGKKEAGFKELFWIKKELEDFLKTRK